MVILSYENFDEGSLRRGPIIPVFWVSLLHGHLGPFNGAVEAALQRVRDDAYGRGQLSIFLGGGDEDQAFSIGRIREFDSSSSRSSMKSLKMRTSMTAAIGSIADALTREIREQESKGVRCHKPIVFVAFDNLTKDSFGQLCHIRGEVICAPVGRGAERMAHQLEDDRLACVRASRGRESDEAQLERFEWCMRVPFRTVSTSFSARVSEGKPRSWKSTVEAAWSNYSGFQL